MSLDTETTGVDLHHGARPFLVTTCKHGEAPYFWEWDVDPYTRQPIVPPEDVEAIREQVATHELVLQNPKFDALGLSLAGIIEEWPWERTWDTLRAGHLLASNQPHDLTTMNIIYLGHNIQPLEDELEIACKEARALAKIRFPSWNLAKEGLEGMPSAKGGKKSKKEKGIEEEKPWKFDMWLPRRIAIELGYDEDHPWWTVASNYANGDSESTLHLFDRMEAEIKRRGLWEIYLTCINVLPVINSMEKYGVTINIKRADEITQQYRQEIDEAANLCLNIAKTYGYDLKLPEGATPNNSLRTFFWDVMGLEKRENPKAKTSNPSLNKEVMEYYKLTLPPNSKSLLFVKTLQGKRSRDTAVSYLDSYRKYWIACEKLDPLDKKLKGYARLYYSLNPTGTDTLRFSSYNPNSQNVSKKEDFNLRYCFGPDPYEEWWTMDAQNIELRLPAYESEEQELIELFERANEPPYYGSNHLLNFHTVYPDIWEAELRVVGLEKVGPHCKKKYASSWYQRCKNGDFAVQYGAVFKADGTGTADRAFGRPGSHARLKARFSRLEALNRRCIDFANRHGYVETIPDRTVNPHRGYPLLCTRTEYGKILETVPLNYHTQGSAMWWMTKAMIRCQKQLDEWNKEAGIPNLYRIVMQVHDELAFSFPRGKTMQDNLWRAKVLAKLMAKGGDDFGIPTPVSMEYHTESWSVGVAA